MQILTDIESMRRALAEARRTAQGPFGLVPTMGALHAGHLSLAARARAECATVVATIFVNPLQFGPNEDFSRYPRQTDADCAAFAAAGVDLVFLPSAAEMYPTGATTTVDVGLLAERLDGRSRPGHFRGVATVVAKLFHIVGPDRAYFGQKDAAQLAVLRRMVRDLDFAVEVIACPIVRDPDGLALSSRNAFLSADERERALTLSQTLKSIESAVMAGERDAARLLGAARAGLLAGGKVELDYLEAVDPHTLENVSWVDPGTLIAIAANVGRTRLIDNLLAP